MAAVATAVLVLVMLSVVRSSRFGVWSMGFWYLVILALFHLGLAIPLGFGYSGAGVNSAYVTSWFGRHSFRVEATYLATLATAAVGAGYTALASSRRVETSSKPTRFGSEGPIGAALTVGGTALTVVYLALTNTAALTGISRMKFVETASSVGVETIGALSVALGALLLATAQASRTRTLGMIAVVVFGSWALSTGARSLIMYTAVAMLLVAIRLRPLPKRRVALGVGAFGLVCVSLVGFYRVDGLARAQIGADALNPLAAITEMGGSIRPLIENLNYNHRLDEEPLWGITYVATIIRTGERLAGLPRAGALQDPRVPGSEIVQRVDTYQIGYSAVAEAYRNWRTPGVVLVFGLFGFILRRIDSSDRQDTARLLASGVIFLALIQHVRQPSNQELPILLTGLLLALGLSIIGPVSRRRRNEENAGLPSTERAVFISGPSTRAAGPVTTDNYLSPSDLPTLGS